ncbi:MAG: HypC/HybG/HupF family hydrogenase formation chaperone [Acidimicrobiia bacterium]
MCLAIPSLVVSMGEQSGGALPAVVSVAGTERSVDLSLVPEATVGDFVVVHSGYAISIVSRERAVETLGMLGLVLGNDRIW